MALEGIRSNQRITATYPEFGAAKLILSGVNLVSGHVYRLILKARSTMASSVQIQVVDENLANQSLTTIKNLSANIWKVLSAEFTAAATDDNSKMIITPEAILQSFYVDEVSIIDLTLERKSYRLVRIQGSMMPGSYIQTLTLREVNAQETA